jgi:hypothetical protein
MVTERKYIGPPSITKEMIAHMSGVVCNQIQAEVGGNKKGDFNDFVLEALDTEEGEARFWAVVDVVLLDALRSAPGDILFDGATIERLRKAVREEMKEIVLALREKLEETKLN